MKKVISIIAILIVVIFIALTALIKIYITPERIKAFIVPAAESSLNRKVSIGEIDVGLVSGISIKDFSIKEADATTDFLKCKSFILKFQLWPLLKKIILIDELKLVSPEIRIERSRQGIFNFESIGKKKESEAAESKDKGLPVSLLISSLFIENSKFSLTDHTKALPDIKGGLDIDLDIKTEGLSALLSEGSVRLKLDELLMHKPSGKKIKDITVTLDYSAHTDLKAKNIVIDKASLRINEIPLSIKGEVKDITATREIDIDVTLPKTKAEELHKLASSFADMKNIKLSGNIAADLSLRGSLGKPENLKAQNNIQLDNIDVDYDGKNAKIDGKIMLSLDSDELEIESAGLKVQDIPVSISGSIAKLKTSPEMDLGLTVPKVSADKIQLAAASFTDMKNIKLSGTASADLKLKGQPKKTDTLRADGNISLEKVGIKYKDIDTVVDGKLKFDKQTVDVNIQGTHGNNTARLEGTVRSLFKNQNINMNLYSKKLILDELIPAGTPEKAPQEGKSTVSTKKPSDPKGLDLKITADGEVKIDTALYNNMSMNNFYLKYEFRDNKLNIPVMKADVGKGKFDLNSSVDFTAPEYSYKLSSRIDSLHADEIVNAFFPTAKDTVFGTLNLNLKLNGSGTASESIRKNLLADGDFIIKNGKITNAKIAENLSMFLDLSELKTVNLNKADGTVRVRNGVARLDSVFVSDDIAMDPSGTIGLDETIDLAFDLKLSPRLTDKAMRNSGIARYIKDEQGQGIIPVKVQGTLSDPSYNIDMEKAGKRVIKKEVDKFIDKLFEEKKKDEKTIQSSEKKTEKSKTEEPQPEEQIKDLLKGVFQ